MKLETRDLECLHRALADMERAGLLEQKVNDSDGLRWSRGYLMGLRMRLSSELEDATDLAAVEAARSEPSIPLAELQSEVYSRPECVFNYCPTPTTAGPWIAAGSAS